VTQNDELQRPYVRFPGKEELSIVRRKPIFISSHRSVGWTPPKDALGLVCYINQGRAPVTASMEHNCGELRLVAALNPRDQAWATIEINGGRPHEEEGESLSRIATELSLSRAPLPPPTRDPVKRVVAPSHSQTS
jgi:hypothetical protein